MLYFHVCNILLNYLRFQQIEHFQSCTSVSENGIPKQDRGCFVTHLTLHLIMCFCLNLTGCGGTSFCSSSLKSVSLFYLPFLFPDFLCWFSHLLDSPNQNRSVQSVLVHVEQDSVSDTGNRRCCSGRKHKPVLLPQSVVFVAPPVSRITGLGMVAGTFPSVPLESAYGSIAFEFL